MAGKFQYISPIEDRPGEFKGQTHGCGCCSDSQTLSVEDVEEHIVELRGAIENAEKVVLAMKRKAEMDAQLKLELEGGM